MSSELRIQEKSVAHFFVRVAVPDKTRYARRMARLKSFWRAALCSVTVAVGPVRATAQDTLRYEFTSRQTRATDTSDVAVRFAISRDNAGRQVVSLTSATVRSANQPAASVTLTDACRAEFGGDPGQLGRVVMIDGIDPHRVVPSCVPESLFGAVTDILAVFLIQHPRFGVQRLRVAGDTAHFIGFVTSWSRAQPEVKVRVAAASGTTSLVTVAGDTSTLRWRPTPMDVTIARRISPQQVALLKGVEYFEVGVTLVHGVVQHARTLTDELDLAMALVPAAQLPDPESVNIAPPGIPVRILRSFEVKRY
jgi:hypothetical protein